MIIQVHVNQTVKVSNTNCKVLDHNLDTTYGIKEKKLVVLLSSMHGGHVGNDYPSPRKPNGQTVKHKLQSTRP